MTEKAIQKRKPKGSGSIRQRPNGTWEGTYTIGVDAETGKQIRRSISGKTKNEVAQRLRKLTVSVDEKRYTDDQRITVGNWLDRWLENGVINVKTGTYADYKRNVELHLKPHLNKIQLSMLRPDDVQNVIKKLSKEGLSPKTVKNVLSCLHQALDYAVDNKLIPYNPASGRKLPKIVKKDIQPLDTPDQIKLFKALEGHELEAFFKTAVFTGMRSGEILGLTWNNIDFENGSINICQQLRPGRVKGEGYTIDTPKNGKARTINPAPSIMQMLKAHKKKQAAMRLQMGDKWNNDFPGLVFTYPDGRHLTQVGVWKQLQKVLASA